MTTCLILEHIMPITHKSKATSELDGNTIYTETNGTIKKLTN